MKKTFIIIMAALAVFHVNVRADKGFTSLESKAKGVALSANGQYVAGIDPSGSSYNSYIYMKSFIYDAAANTTQWLTQNDKTDLSKGGAFTAVSDNGTVCGRTKDLDQLYNNKPLNVAAVWTKDGKHTLLGFGDFDKTKIKSANDGSYANAISADGKTVAGEFRTGNGAYLTPCRWTQAADGTWTLSWLTMPEGARGGQTNYISADGKTIGGTLTQADKSKCIALWKDGTCTLVTSKELKLTETAGSIELMGMSRNGRYVVALPQGGYYFYLYDTETGDVRSLSIMDYIYSSQGYTLSSYGNFAIDDDGNMIFTLIYNKGAYNRPMWYDHEADRTLELSYYIDLFAHGVATDLSLDEAVTAAVSADGSVIMGNNGNTAWILRTDKGTAEIPATPTGLRGTMTALGQVTLTWNKDLTAYKDFTLKAYNVYCNDKKVAEVEATGSEMKAVVNDVPAGKAGFEVEAVFERTDGTTLLSPKSASTIVTVASDFALPLFEDFTSGGIDENYWEMADNGDGSYNFSVSIDDAYGMQFTNGLAMRNQPGKPYSFSLMSRPMDASKSKTVNLSFYINHGLINSDSQVLDKDSLGMDITTDNGLTWQNVRTWDVATIAPSHRYWTQVALDLSTAAAGKTFRMRFHLYGPGTTHYFIGLDNISVTEAASHEAPTGLMSKVSEDGKTVSLAWKNNSQAYKLNYINEVPSYRFTIGNGGEEVIGANKFEPSDLKMYDKKYLTGVSTKINYYEDKSSEQGIRASVVVYEDGKLVREQEATAFPYNEEFTVVLDKPLQIDATKTLMIGVKVFDYDADQIPLSYVQSLNYQPGKSDLYSEDGGKTWQLVSDFYNENYQEEADKAKGWCCWDITGCVTDEPALTVSDTEDPFTYVVYRNGEQYSRLAVSGKSARFTDEQPVSNATYEVVAYYPEGDYSAMSEPLTIGDLSSVVRYVADDTQVNVSLSHGTLTVTGNYDSASLIGIDGQLIAGGSGNSLSAAGLAPGVYLVKTVKDGKTVTRKIMVAR